MIHCRKKNSHHQLLFPVGMSELLLHSPWRCLFFGQAGAGRGLHGDASEAGGAEHVLRRPGLVDVRADPLARYGEGYPSGQRVRELVNSSCVVVGVTQGALLKLPSIFVLYRLGAGTSSKRFC